MAASARSRRARVAVLALAHALASALAGCTTWRAQPLPRPGVAPARVGHVRATRVDGTQVELALARIEGDTLRGERWRIDRTGERVPVAIPLDSLRRLDARRVSAGRTVALVGGIVAVPAVLFALLLAAYVTGTGY